MYACIPENGGGFFQGACAPSNATVHFTRPTPTPQRERTGAPAMGLRPEVNYAPRYRERRFSLV